LIVGVVRGNDGDARMLRSIAPEIGEFSVASVRWSSGQLEEFLSRLDAIVFHLSGTEVPTAWGIDHPKNCIFVELGGESKVLETKVVSSFPAGVVRFDRKPGAGYSPLTRSE
jgi:hypothetical protein